MSVFDLSDYGNLFAVLKRAQFNGLDEAAVGVALAQKINAAASALQASKPVDVEKTEVAETPANDEA